MSDNFVNATFKASSTIFDDHTEITWNSPICAFVIECRLIDGGDGRWEEIGRVPADRGSFSLANWAENSKFQYRVVAKMINEITLASESTGISSLASTVKDEMGDDGTTMDCKPMSVQVFAVPPVNTPPPPPLDLKYERISTNHIKLSWDPPTIGLDDPPITSYIIERSNIDNPIWSRPMRIIGGETTATLKLNKAEHQTFRIMAENASGDVSTPLESEQIRPLPRPGPPKVMVDTASRKYIELNWSIPNYRNYPRFDKTTSFQVRRREGDSKESIRKAKFVTVSKSLAGHKANSYRDINVVPDRMYQYEVVSVSSNGKESATATSHVQLKSDWTQESEGMELSKAQKRMERKMAARKRKDLALSMKNSKKAIKQEDEPGPSGTQQQQIPVKNEVAPISSKLVKMEVDSD